MGGKKMAEEKKQDKIQRGHSKGIAIDPMKGITTSGTQQQSGIDQNTLMVIIILLIKRLENKEGNEKGIDTLASLLLMMQ